MSLKSLRVGIVGVGMAGDFTVRCLQRVHGVDVQLVGATARTAERREAFAARFSGMRPFASVEAMLPEIDMLCICTPAHVHADLILQAARAGKAVTCEKPLTGYFGPSDADDAYTGNTAPKQEMLERVLDTMRGMKSVVDDSGIAFGYGENFVYAPSMQKEREIIEKTKAQILRMQGEESHSGSSSPVYGIWRYSGGGSLMGKGVHPLGGMLYLKRIEGLARDGRPIRPTSVSARIHELTRLPTYADSKLLRTDYHDVEDYGTMHVTFEDGTVADLVTSEVVLGGVYEYVNVFANNHRTHCNIAPVHMMDVFNPRREQFDDIYIVERLNTKEGWSPASPDEPYTRGYIAEFQDFATAAASGFQPQSNLDLAIDVTATVYAAYISAERRGAEVDVPLL